MIKESLTKYNLGSLFLIFTKRNLSDILKGIYFNSFSPRFCVPLYPKFVLRGQKAADYTADQQECLEETKKIIKSQTSEYSVGSLFYVVHFFLYFL